MKRIRTRAQALRARRCYSIAPVLPRRVIGRFEAKKPAAAPAMPEPGPTRRMLTNRPRGPSTRRTPSALVPICLFGFPPIKEAARKPRSGKIPPLLPRESQRSVRTNGRPVVGDQRKGRTHSNFYTLFQEKYNPPCGPGLRWSGGRGLSAARADGRGERLAGGRLSCLATFGCNGRTREQRSKGSRSGRARRRGLRPVYRNLSRRGHA